VLYNKIFYVLEKVNSFLGICMRTLTKENLYDYVTGSAILGCGGGGSVESGNEMINEAFKKGYKFNLADINEIDEEKILCVLAGVGGGVPQEIKDKVAPYTERFEQSQETRLARLSKSAEELSAYIGKEIFSYIAAETGAGNGVLPMYLNAREEKPSIDGDCCGRAKPEMGLSLTKVANIPVTPLAMISPFMETVILKNAVDDDRAEDITRSVAVASGGGVTVARCPATVNKFKQAIAPNQVTKCIQIGQVIREAKKANKSPKDDFIKTSKAIKIFEGRVKSFEMEGKGGFNWGNWYIDGVESYKNHKMKIWFKNEHLVGWMDENPYITCPDLICIVDSKTCQGYSNFTENGRYNGKLVSVYGIRAIDQWRTRKGIEVFGPKHFGFDINYKPFEKIV
jgi:DUF917 family protein